ncbi:hypothetical protein C1645_807045 [Glomus cerebriforme]|uniref:Capsule synthesis protein CapA domain-containing protein n=1 Tax=Glomus cerebriforme TaxID=658196 RepID=A0A397SST9_9GLOM|nr:hypothetical protein C1645_807045 [Glomus cerebriforme]
MDISGKFSITLVGGIMLGQLINQLVFENNHSNIVNKHKYPYGNTLDVLNKDADFFIGNLETTITTESKTWPKSLNVRFFPRHIQALTLLTPQFSNILPLTPSFVSTNLSHVSNSSPLFVSLANDRILDYGYAGYRETIKTLNDNQINYAGVGDFKEQAMDPCIVNINAHDGTTLQIACFSAADHPQEWSSCYKNSGKCHIPIPNIRSPKEHAGLYFISPVSSQNLLEFQNQVQKYRKYVDLIVVSLRFSQNSSWKPRYTLVNFARRLIDAGVDVIHGHSSLHIQGIEIYKGKPIFYGCGDFVNDYLVNPEFRNDLGFIYTLHLSVTPAKHIKFTKIDLHPKKIDLLQVNLLEKKEEESDYEWLIDKMKSLCNDFGTKCVENHEGGLVINI